MSCLLCVLILLDIGSSERTLYITHYTKNDFLTFDPNVPNRLTFVFNSLRINKGPTKGYENDVGSKTTHRILYPESAVDLDNSTHLVLFPYKMQDLQWLISSFTTRHIKRLVSELYL